MFRFCCSMRVHRRRTSAHAQLIDGSWFVLLTLLLVGGPSGSRLWRRRAARRGKRPRVRRCSTRPRRRPSKDATPMRSVTQTALHVLGRPTIYYYIATPRRDWATTTARSPRSSTTLRSHRPADRARWSTDPRARGQARLDRRRQPHARWRAASEAESVADGGGEESKTRSRWGAQAAARRSDSDHGMWWLWTGIVVPWSRR